MHPKQPSLKFNFFYPTNASFERWDYRNPGEVGIGGSETSFIEMAQRLARRGHRVTAYAPVRSDCASVDDAGVSWIDCASVDWAKSGIWILYRCPQFVDHLPEGARAWLVCQDEDYIWEVRWQAKLHRVLALCNVHTQAMRQYPLLKWKVHQTSNGIKVANVWKAINKNYKRDPKRLFYASSPDRALLPLLNAFKVAYEFDPELSLYIAYGFNNIEKVANTERLQARLKDAIKQPGVTWLGRLNQDQVLEEWTKAGLCVYPCCDFRETGWITGMEAQACGAIPIVSPLWAVAEHTMGGSIIEGDTYNDPTVQSELVQTILEWAHDPTAQAAMRSQLMPAAMERFDWDNFVTQWEEWGFRDSCTYIHTNQFSFQRTHVRGNILNVGCMDDPAYLKRDFGATNLDVTKHSPHVDYAGDARHLPSELYGKFDSVVLGDILEHFLNQEDAIQAILEAKKCLVPGGRLVITSPCDDRNEREGITPQGRYTEGVADHHLYAVSLQHIKDWCMAAGMRVVLNEHIAYPFCSQGGNGVVAIKGEYFDGKPSSHV